MLSVKELKSLNQKELQKALMHAQGEMQKIRLTIKTGHEKNTSFSKKWKKQTARIFTFLNKLKIEEPAAEKEVSSSSEAVTQEAAKQEAKPKKKTDRE